MKNLLLHLETERSGLVTLGDVLGTVHWEAVLCREKPFFVRGKGLWLPHQFPTFHLPVPGPPTVSLRHQQHRANDKKNFPIVFL